MCSLRMKIVPNARDSLSVQALTQQNGGRDVASITQQRITS